MGGTPDQGTLWEAVAAACRAPSVHNTQPWSWRVDRGGVHLRADWTRLPATDPDRRDVLLSCGVALHRLRIALAALGWACAADLLPDPTDPDHVAAVRVWPRGPQDAEVGLAVGITARRSDPEGGCSSPVSTAHLLALGGAAAAEGVDLAWVSGAARRTLLGAAALAAGVQENGADHGAELLPRSGPDGVPADARLTGGAVHDVQAGRLFPVGGPTAAPVPATGADASELLVVATATDTPADRLRAGAATSAVLLTATHLGLATCPVSQAMETRQSRALIAGQVLGGRVEPQIVLRVGHPSPTSSPLDATPRRPPGAVAEFAFDALRLRRGRPPGSPPGVGRGKERHRAL